MLGDVVNKQRPHGAAVVRGGDGPVALLPGRISDLGLDLLALDLDALGGKLDADGRPRLHQELVLMETREKVGLADTTIANEDDFEEEVETAPGPSTMVGGEKDGYL